MRLPQTSIDDSICFRGRYLLDWFLFAIFIVMLICRSSLVVLLIMPVSLPFYWSCLFIALFWMYLTLNFNAHLHRTSSTCIGNVHSLDVHLASLVAIKWLCLNNHTGAHGLKEVTECFFELLGPPFLPFQIKSDSHSLEWFCQTARTSRTPSPS